MGNEIAWCILFLFARLNNKHLPKLTMGEWAVLHTLSDLKGSWARNVIAQHLREKYPLLSCFISVSNVLNSLYQVGGVETMNLSYICSSTYKLSDEGAHLYRTYTYAMHRVIS